MTIMTLEIMQIRIVNELAVVEVSNISKEEVAEGESEVKSMKSTLKDPARPERSNAESREQVYFIYIEFGSI